MTTDVEHGSEFSHLGQDVAELDGVGPELLVLEEVGAEGVVLEALDRAGVEGSETTLGRRDHDLGLVLEDMVGVGEFRLQSVSFVHHTYSGSILRMSCPGILTKNQPVGLPLAGNLSWEVRTKRTLGVIVYCMLMMQNWNDSEQYRGY